MKNMFLSRKEKKKEEAAPQGGGISRALGKVSFEGFDWWLFTLMLIILAIGLIMVLSASGIVAEQVNGDKYYFFKRQLIFACGGGLVLWGAALMPRSWLYKLQYPAIFLSLFLLLLTLSPLTPSINGAKRWIPLGPVNLQPMEFVKISLALYLAYFMSSKQALVKTFSRGVIPPFAVTGLFCGLLLLQLYHLFVTLLPFGFFLWFLGILLHPLVQLVLVHDVAETVGLPDRNEIAEQVVIAQSA